MMLNSDLAVKEAERFVDSLFRQTAQTTVSEPEIRQPLAPPKPKYSRPKKIAFEINGQSIVVDGKEVKIPSTLGKKVTPSIIKHLAGIYNGARIMELQKGEWVSRSNEKMIDISNSRQKAEFQTFTPLSRD